MNNNKSAITQSLAAYLSHKPFFYGFIRPQEVHYFRKFSKYIKPPVLDFGADDGFFAQLAFKTPLEYGLDLPGTGLDSDRAKKTYTHRLFYDGGSIPLKDNSAQTVVSNCVFEHVADIKLSFQEMFRVLKPGGYLVATMLTATWEDYLIGGQVIGKSYRDFLRQQQVHKNLFSLDSWSHLYNQTGFKVIRKAGYISSSTAMYLEISHYLAIPQLLGYKLFGKWLLLNRSGLANAISKVVARDVSVLPEKAACIFLIAQKPDPDEA
jgi:SAM-dependent methyltransferase